MLEAFHPAGQAFLAPFLLLLLLLAYLGEVFFPHFRLGRNDAVLDIVLQSIEHDERGIARDDGVLLA